MEDSLIYKTPYRNGDTTSYEVFYYNNVKIGEFYMEIDGYWVFEPNDGCGYWSQYVLRAVADELEKMNKNWDEELNKFFNAK